MAAVNGAEVAAEMAAVVIDRPLASRIGSESDGNSMSQEFLDRLKGPFRGMLHWSDLDALWVAVRAKPEGWYISMVGEEPVPQTMTVGALNDFITEVDALLRREHDCTHCGIVYADDMEAPTLIKIHDPNSVGSSCSSTPVPPRWMLSRMLPSLIADDAPLPGNRRRWWQKLLGD
jgi:hypothetical protein